MATTTNYSWTTPDNTAYVKDGASAIRTLGSSVDTTLFTALGGAYPGLRLIKKQTVGTSVTSVTLTNVFSATYEGYRIIYTGGACAATTEITIALNGNTTNYRSFMSYGNLGTNSVSGVNFGSNSAFGYIGGGSTNGASVDFELWNPFAAKQKWGKGTFSQFSTTGVVGHTFCYNNNTTSSTDFTMAGGTFTAGTIYVYGYGAS